MSKKSQYNMKHPTDDMLLAYVRQQHALWPSDIREHVALCPMCSERCAEFKVIGNTLEVWAHSSAVDPSYATVSNRVMHTLYEPKAASVERMRHIISRVRGVLPVALVLVLLCAILLTGLVGVKIAGNVANSHKLQPVQKVPQHPTATQRVPIATLEPMPTVTSVPVGPVPTTTVAPGNGGLTATPTPQSGPSIAVNTPCTTVIDVIENQLHVCGTRFTPGTTVTIDYHIGTKSKKQTVQVGDDGTFIDVLYIHSCKDVPDAVYVQSSANPPETAQIAKNITFGTCQSFGKLRKLK